MTAFTVTAGVLHEAAEWAARATPAKSPIPILMGLLIDAADGQLVLSGFDLERRATATIDAAVTKPGRMLVPARLLVDVAKVAGKAELRVDDSSGSVTVLADRARWTLPSLQHDEYPKLPDQGDPVGTVNAGDLRMAVRRVIHAASTDPTLPMLTGIRLEGDATELTLAATNRFQMAAAVIPWSPTKPDEPFEMLVPADLLGVATRAAGSDADTLTLTTAGGHLLGLETPGHLTTGRVLDCEFPRWRPLMDRAAPTGRHISLVTADMLRAITQASTTATDRTDQLTLTVTKDLVQVTVTGDDRSSVIEFPADTEGEDIVIAFNSRYLKDALDACASERATIHFGESNTRPALAVGDDPGSYRHLVMPVKLPGAAA
ncbi:MAG TPA: DNA polymerase III subunit beta [Mycobacterium sp.]|jgi:DNA polymerase-3 subunit beta|uniref:DNA polymerase III subunit beta n=1 Tax=Mycobacterium sp. TaxID=1785 RepID=UPI002F42996F